MEPDRFIFQLSKKKEQFKKIFLSLDFFVLSVIIEML